MPAKMRDRHDLTQPESLTNLRKQASRSELIVYEPGRLVMDNRTLAHKSPELLPISVRDSRKGPVRLGPCPDPIIHALRRRKKLPEVHVLLHQNFRQLFSMAESHGPENHL
jgi:hypothetical protein